MALELNGTTGVSLVQDGVVTAADLASGAITSAALPTGTVLQVVSTTKTDTFSASLGQNASATITGLNLTITPSSASSKILLFASVTMNNGLEVGGNFTIQRNSSDILIPSAGSGIECTAVSIGLSTNKTQLSTTMHGIDEPSTTSSISYTVTITNVASTTRTMTVNTSGDPQARGISTITAMEIAG